MKTLPRILLITIVLMIAGGVAFLATWSPKPPSSPVEKILPDGRFPQ